MTPMTQLLAYVGPGPGLTMVWAFVALIGTILLALGAVLIWPLRVMLRKMREGRAAAPDKPPAPETSHT